MRTLPLLARPSATRLRSSALWGFCRLQLFSFTSSRNHLTHSINDSTLTMAITKPTELSEYERRRQETIAKNQALLRSLALDAASAGLAPSAKPSRSSTPSSKPSRKPAAPRKIKEEALLAPRRTSSRLRGIVADSEVAKRKAEEETAALQLAERAKRQRRSGELYLGDVVVAGREWGGEGGLLRGVGLGPAQPYERTFVKGETGSREVREVRERLGRLELWEGFEPNSMLVGVWARKRC